MRRIATRHLGVLTSGLFLVLSACASHQHRGPNETIGTLAGAGIGGYLGSEIGGEGTSGAVGAAMGTLAGAMIGQDIGKRLDEADRREHARTTQHTLENTPTGRTKEWENPDTGNRGRVQPTRTYENADGRPCREFTQTIVIDGEEVQGHGTACRQPDGTWKIVSEQRAGARR